MKENNEPTKREIVLQKLLLIENNISIVRREWKILILESSPINRYVV